MAIDGGERTCGVHELICIRKVSPEAIGFLSAVGLSTVLLLLLFFYINRKMCHGKNGGFHCAKNNRGQDLHGSSSESEDEAVGKYHEAMTRLNASRPGSEKQQNYMWETWSKYSPLSAEYDGYSSEVSADEGVLKPKDLPEMSVRETNVPNAMEREAVVGIDTSKDLSEVESIAVDQIKDLVSEESDVKIQNESGKETTAATLSISAGPGTDESAQNKKKKDRKKNKQSSRKPGCCG